MSNIALRVDNLSKLYHIGASLQHYATLRDVLAGWLTKPLRRTRPDRASKNGRQPDTIWALKDVSFEIRPGEVVGIIGRNGAGKSTLLKILSQITEPTYGRAEIFGRVSSLLEVGTGFHPELTGRENIYLNGAILGMRRAEINRKFDEIVAFAEIEKFLDTPVKHYSSGMYVRLAFAVAAHLEPDILIVDEVLAVGDAAFQKKCLGKMGDVATEGRTVLFVSHNMGAIRSLCERSILLVDGQLEIDGPTQAIVNAYLLSVTTMKGDKGEIHWAGGEEAPGCDEVRLSSIHLISHTGKVQNTFQLDKSIVVEVTYIVHKPLRGMRIVLKLKTEEGVIAFASTDHNQQPAELQPGRYMSTVTVPGGILNRNKYYIHLSVDIPGVKVLIPGTEYLSLTCIGESAHGSNFPENWPGVFALRLEWSFERLDSMD
jgi:lipopolysaccharide transport system ATP-binding protein